MGTFNFDEFYTKSIPSLEKYAFYYVSSTTVAHDIAIEMLNKFWEIKDSFDNEQAALAYLKVMVRNKALNYIRHIQSKLEFKERMDEDSPAPERDGNSWDFLSNIPAIVETTLLKMPEKTRSIFRMSRYEHLPHRQIAAETGLSEKSVEYHIAKATRILREAMKDFL